MAGVLSGLFGIGGGIVIVPMLILLVGLTTTRRLGLRLLPWSFPSARSARWSTGEGDTSIFASRRFWQLAS